MDEIPPLVSTQWLRERTHGEGDPNLVILDSTWDIETPRVGHQTYSDKHIPGALYFDLNKCIHPRPTCPRNLPNVTEFAEYARSLGISTNTHLVVYDSSTIYASTKAWWIFRVFGHERVSVLDGGLMQWKADGYPVSSGGNESTTRGDFQVRQDKAVAVEYEEMMTMIKTGCSQVIDCRLPEHFSGAEKEPTLFTRLGLESMDMPVPESVQAGHMPGAVNICLFDVFRKGSHCFLSKQELLQLFDNHVVDLTKPLVSTCYMGHAASLINMAAAICGYRQMALYYGSWTEYGQLSSPELVVKDA